jgi:2-succinyl-5-enolpyruvyl-6-hydroxy-3-cyclohexene-1-carboxylate synthase
MPVRDLEAFGLPRTDPPTVYANRGANGIDGVMSTALGVAMAGGPTVVLVGDLAFLHDVSALVGPTGEVDQLTVVVADNGGGGIFSFLAPATSLDPETFERLFGTPQSADVATVAAGFGWAVEEVGVATGPHELDAALERAAARGGRTVVRVGLPDRAANVAAHDRVNAAVVAAVEG